MRYLPRPGEHHPLGHLGIKCVLGAPQQPKVRSDRGPNPLTDRLGADLDGMLAEYVVLSEEVLVHVLHPLSYEEAATLPCAAVTAWVAPMGYRQATAGDAVLRQVPGVSRSLRSNLPGSWAPG